MNSAADALRAAAAQLLAKAAELDGQGPTSPGFDMSDWRTWWPAILEQYRNDRLPHGWVDWAPGTPPDRVGDNDQSDDDFLRVFKPFMDAATRDQQRDSTGAIFFFPNVKRRTGLGWEGVKSEVRRLWITDWGVAWRLNEDNIKAGLVPKSAP